MHYLHEHTLPCYHESLHNVFMQLRNNQLQIATRIFLRQGYFPERNSIFIICYCTEFAFFFFVTDTEPKGRSLRNSA